MIEIRKSEERGHASHGWLETYHTFSFASYFDPEHTKFRALRVINEDWIKGGMGFGTYPHENMEIVTYVIDGELEHRDSMGNGSVIRPGELQRMTAGTGITHSEFNPSDRDTHLLQIWIYPEKSGLPPSYEQRAFPALQESNSLILLASRNGLKGTWTFHQDVEIFGGRLDAGRHIDYPIPTKRHLWLQLIRGHLDINGVTLNAGDGAAVSHEKNVTLTSCDHTEFLLFNLA